MRIGLLGGLRVEHDGRPVAVSGAMQLAVLFRLAVDAGTVVSYRAISEDIWGIDGPENTRAALQSIVSRLRSQLPPESIESSAGGYRLAVTRTDVDALVFSDLVATAEGAPHPARLAAEALGLWAGEPWIPSDNFDWFVRDLERDHIRALDLGGRPPAAAPDLPAQLTTLVGREPELATIAEQLRTNRLVTIIGTGGAGKTRLALAAASEQRASILVTLAPVGPGEVLGAVLAATGREIRTAEAGSDTVGNRDRVLDSLVGRDVLLVLDNCEHVIDAIAALAQDLLSTLPRLRILATSREPLGLPGEAFVDIGPLSHPIDSAIAVLDEAALREFAAIELFGQRAQSARGRAVDGAELAIAAHICARLDGLPLAIELAAAKLRTMGVDEVLAGLDDRFALLSGGYRTVLPRHQTLRAMIDWSWSLLDDDERRALARFSVFPSGASAADARALATALGLPSASVFDSLVDRSLLQRSRGRYRALETIREYGIERLSDAGELADARTTQARYMTERASEFDRLLRGKRIIEAIEWFDAEDDNLVSAIRFASAVPLAPTAVHLTVSCCWYWVLRDRNEDAMTWMSAVAPLASGLDGDEAKILTFVSPLVKELSLSQSEDFEPDVLGKRLGPLMQSMNVITVGAGSHELLQLLVPTLTAFASVVSEPDWMNRVRLPDGEALGLDPWPTAAMHVIRAVMAHNRGSIDELGTQSEIALGLFGSIGDLWGTGIAQQARAEWLMLQGRLHEALELSDASTDSMRRISSGADVAQQQSLAINILSRLGRKDEARKRVEAIVETAEKTANARAMLHVQTTALILDITEGDLVSARSRLAVIEKLYTFWRGAPGQVSALVETVRASMARQQGDFATAESHLQIAAQAAIRSHDQPVIGSVILQIGMLARDRGDLPTALRAVDFAAMVIGARDETHPDVRAILEAAEAAGIGHPGAEAPERPIALGSLLELLG